MCNKIVGVPDTVPKQLIDRVVFLHNTTITSLGFSLAQEVIFSETCVVKVWPMQHHNLTNIAVSKQLLENVQLKAGCIVNVWALPQPAPLADVVHFQIG